MSPQKIKPFLWYDHQAEEAAKFYCSLFPDSRIVSMSRVPPGMPGEVGKVMTVEFELAGVRYVALNGGPHFKLSEAFSLCVLCDDQAEVDRLWDALVEGGEPSHCGWLKDRYGLSWQITPKIMLDIICGGDVARATRATQAMLKMSKLNIAELEAAANAAS